MQLESLKMFCDTARFRSFSRAAEENNVTQSMISQAVNHLEKHLEIELIDRTRRPWDLTRQGREFFRECSEIIEKYYALENRIRGSRPQLHHTIRAGAIYSVGLRHMSNYISKFRHLNPEIRVDLDYLHPHKVYEYVLQDKIDFGIVSFPQQRRDIDSLSWQTEPMLVACCPDHPFSDEIEVPVELLATEKMVGFDKDLVIRKEIDRYLKEYHVSPEVVLEFDNIESIKRAVEIGTGIAMLPGPTFDREVKNGSLRAVPLKGREFVRPLGIIMKKRKKVHPVAQDFMDFLMEAVSLKRSVS